MDLQTRLFVAPSSLDRRARVSRLALGGTAFVDHAPNLVRGDDALFDRLRAERPWVAAEREMYDRTVDIPRLLSSYEEGEPVDPLLAEVSAWLSARYERPVDRISLALYRDGTDSVAWHGDRMGEQVADCIVAILSLRGPRRLRMRPKARDRAPLAFDLGHGDLLAMGGSCQRDWEHAVPKVTSAPPRMSVMFRSARD